MARYTDIDFLLSKNSITNDANVKLDVNAIAQSIKNIILSSKTEKPFNPQFGANGYDLLHESMSAIEKDIIKSNIAAELRLQEPRAEIREINIEDGKNGKITISVSFSPIYDETVVRNLNLEFTVSGE